MSWDLTQTSNDFLSRVGALTWTDVADWLTEAEVFGYFDEAAKRLATLGLFVQRELLNTGGNVAVLALPADWIDSIHVSVNGVQLRPSSAAELFAFDSLWPQLICEPGALPSRYSMDAGPLGTITLYPIPVATGELELVDHVLAPTIDVGDPLAPIPSVLSDYFLYYALQRARGKESPYAMPEVAAAASAQCALYEKIIAAYWGGLER